ncbi:MAG: hypothetical protein LUG85_03195 [Clostridiales bacterium]|nr:hypothetical protein [Clostridiales bacterium]
MSGEKNREYYIKLLRSVAADTGRLPKKSDFAAEDINKIKGYFGPWRYALEAAGLIASKREDKAEKNREKRLKSRNTSIK